MINRDDKTRPADEAPDAMLESGQADYGSAGQQAIEDEAAKPEEEADKSR